MIMHINLEFRNAAQVLPKVSNRYVCLTGKTMQVLQYSAKYNLFNVYDWEEVPAHAIKVMWWAPVPAPLKDRI